jgi:hypothetical protein
MVWGTSQFNFQLLILNDGQLLNKVKVKEALLELYSANRIPPIIVCGSHALTDCMNMECRVCLTDKKEGKGVEV